MSIRQEVLGSLYAQVEHKKIIPLKSGGLTEARRRLEKARLEYEDARKEVLVHELPRYYKVAIFGSARLNKDSSEFRFISDLTCGLVEARNIDIVTGGGPGLMEAAHFGQRMAIEKALQNGTRSYSKNHGIIIRGLSTEQKDNEHIDIRSSHAAFSTRLQEFLDRTHGAYNAPGGIGTLLEKLIVLQLKQVGHLEDDYFVMAHPMWEPIVNCWNDELYNKRHAREKVPLISETDLKLIRFSDNIPDIVDKVSQSYDIWRAKFQNHIRIFHQSQIY